MSNQRSRLLTTNVNFFIKLNQGFILECSIVELLQIKITNSHKGGANFTKQGYVSIPKRFDIITQCSLCEPGHI